MRDLRNNPTKAVFALVLLAAGSSTALAAQDPRIVDIRIVGNEVTQPQVILREIDLDVGDRADAVAIEHGRQAVQDLGLFREVAIDVDPHGDGVALVVRVREKRYFLPVPRLDGNSEGDYSYGAQIRWSNVFGLNHRLIAYVEEGRVESERDRESERSVRLRYSAPYLGDTDYSANMFADRTEQVSLDRAGNTFDETFHRLEIVGTRDFRSGRPRSGWILGSGLYWQDQTAKGLFAPLSDGRATAAVGTAEYSDLRFNLYSQTGRDFQARAEVAREGTLSDYSYERLDLDYRDFRRFGQREHQTLHLLAAGGVVTGGPRSRNTYSLGGSRRLRGYDSDAVEGDTYWYLAGEYLRPLRWDWLRLLATVEVGGARRNVFNERNRNAYASVGLGLRARITWFVDIEIEAGIAMPLIDGDGLRFFASSN
jgi:outer membrane protein assembly factor BamA